MPQDNIFFDSLPVGYVSLDCRGLIHQINQIGADLLGAEPTRLQGTSLATMLADADRPVFNCFLQRVFAGQNKELCQVQLICATSLIHLRIEARYPGDGLLCHSVITNITDFKRMQETLRDNEKYRDQMQAMAHIGSWDWDADTDTYVWSPEVYRIYGLDPTRPPPTQADLIALFTPESFKNRNAARERALKTGEPYMLDLEINRSDGIRRSIALLASVRHDATGRINGLHGIVHDVTERKQIEQALRESNERLSISLDVGNAGTWEWDRQTGSVHFDDRFHLMLGYAPGELPTRVDLWNSSHYHHPDDIPLMLARAESYLRGETSVYESEHRIRNKAGAWSWVFTRGKLVQLSSSGSPTLFIGIVMDINVRKQAEESLRESQLMLSLFMRHSPIYTFIKEVTATESRVLQASDNYQGMVGISGLQMSGKTMEDLFPLELARKITADDQAVVASGHVLKLEEELNGRNYTTIKFPISLGDKTLLAGYTIDNTERQQAEAAMKQEQMFAQALLDSLPGIFYLYSYPELRLVKWNKNHETLLGYTADEVKDRHITSWHVPEAKEAILQAIAKVIQEGREVVEAPLVAKDGRQIPFLLTGVRFEAQGQLYLMGMGFDITERKQAEEALQAAKSAAESANTVKDQFLAKLSHELRTPLTPVLLATSRWQTQTDIPSSFRDDLGMISRNLELEARMLEDLLDVNRILHGKLSLRRQGISVHQAIHQALAIVASTLEDKRLQLSVQLQATNDCVEADPARLQQILWNLLSNAVKFTPESGRIAVTTLDSPGGQIAIQIADSGVGITPEFLPRLFEPFEQASQRTNFQYGGLGMGMTICKSLVDAHGGSITVASEGIGKGAVFTVCLPLGHASAVAAPAASPPGPDPIAQTRPLRILLVEDNLDTIRLLSRLLRNIGHDVRSAGDVASALGCAQQSGFDLLISDLGLPDGSGLDLMRELVATGRAIKSIAVSGYGTEDDIRKSREAGFAEHLVKPVNLAQLLKVIQQVANT